MRSFFIIALLICLPLSFSFGESNKTHPSPSFLRVFNKLFKSRKDRQAECDYSDGKCLFVHNPETSPSQSNDILEQCALDLCGPPNTSINYSSYMDSYIEDLVQADLVEEWEREFQDLGIGEIIEDLVDTEARDFDRLRKAFQESDMSRKSRFNYLKPEDYNTLSKFFFREYIEIDTDKSRPLSERLRIHINLPEKASRQLKEGLKLYAQDWKNQINSSLFNQMRRDIYTRQEAHSLLKDKWKNFTDKYEQEKKSNDSFDKDDSLSKEMDEIREDMEQLAEDMTNLSPEENQLDLDLGSPINIRPTLTDVAENIEHLEQNFIKEKTGLQSETEKQSLCQKKACQKAVEEIIEELFSQYETPLFRKNIADRHLAQCFSKFVQFKQMERELPEGLNIPDVKQNFFDRVLANFSEPTRESFEGYINDGFQMKPIISNSQDLKSSLEDLAITNKKLRGREWAPIDQHSEKKKSYVNLIGNMYIDRKILKNKAPCDWFPLKATDLFIDQRNLSESERYIMTQKMQNTIETGGISLSLFSCLHPSHGQGITSHEMGHLLSWMFSQNKLSDISYTSYKKLRECATKRYKYQRPRQHYWYHENDRWRTEEDTADLISYLATSDSKIHYSCAFLDITKNGIQYKGLSIFNNDPRSIYSTPLLRVIFEAIHKKTELSPACQQVIEQHKKDINFTPCF